MRFLAKILTELDNLDGIFQKIPLGADRLSKFLFLQTFLAKKKNFQKRIGNWDAI